MTLVPAHKSDLDAVAPAKAAGIAAFEPCLPALLERLKDANWPVAEPMAELLAEAGPAIGPHILEVLRGTDDLWKLWVLSLLGTRCDAATRQMFLDECVRITNAPTDGEKQEGVDGAAMEVIILHSHDG